MPGSAGAAASAPPGGGPMPPDADGGFVSLIERARAAHHAEVEELKLEVLGLRRELLAVRGQLGGQPVAGARPEAQDIAAIDLELVASEGPQQSKGTGGKESILSASSVVQRWSASSKDSQGSGKAGGLHHAAHRQQHSRGQLIRRKGYLWGLVTSPAFEVTIAAMIIANATVLALEAQYKGFSLATRTGHASAVGESAEVWPLAEDAFAGLSWTFGVVFSLELVLKIVGLRSDFLRDAWNWLDTVIVLLWLASQVLQRSGNVQFLRVVRIARLVRLARILKILKTHATDGLFLMATALTGTVSSTGWCFVFVITLHALMALGMNQFLHEAYFDLSSSTVNEQIMMYEYFGSFSRAFLTMLEITFGNWVVPIRHLMESVDESFILYGMLHKIIIGFAVVGVLNALFVQETFKAASLDDNLMVRQQQARQRHHRKKMTQLFAEADTDENGTLDMDEWMAVCQDEWVQVWLESQEIKAENARRLFDLIDDGDGRLTAEEVVKGTALLKGTSGIIEIMTIVQQINTRVKDIRAELLFSQPFVAQERM